jgi:predicted RNase H-like HicB family nuclease
MRTVTVIYHCEDGKWWGDSPDAGLETFVAGGRTLDETRALAQEGLEFHLSEVVRIEEYFAPGNTLTRIEVDHDSPLIASGAGTSSGASGLKVPPLAPSQPSLITC